MRVLLLTEWLIKMADILSMQYRSVFSKPKTDLTNLKFKSISSPNLEDVELRKEDFLEAMKNLDPSLAPGPDNIPAFFYKDCAEESVYSIMKIWRIFLDTGLLPERTAQTTIGDSALGGLTEFWELCTMILCAPKYLKRQ